MTFVMSEDRAIKAIQWETFQAAASRAAEGCEDYRIVSRETAYEPGDFLRFHYNVEWPGIDPAMTYRGDLTQHAFGQLLERLDGPPAQWAGNPKHTDDDLRAAVMNDLIRARKPMDLLLRTRGDTLRAVLSDQYTPFDNVALLDLVGGALSQMGEAAGDVRVHKAQIGDELRGYVLLPGITFASDPGGGKPGGGMGAPEGWEPGDATGNGGNLHPGVYVSNSEVGSGKVRIHGGLFRGVCSNGMIYGWGAKDQGALELIHRGVSERTMTSAVSDALVAALRMSETGAQRFIESQAEILEPKRIPALAREWGDRYGLTLPSIEAWTTLVGAEAASNGRPKAALFDLVNGLTFLARDKRGQEGETMERLAGDLLFAELPVSVYAAAGQTGR